ncbi:MAG TPA: glucokinase [Bacteroidota bacterium]
MILAGDIGGTKTNLAYYKSDGGVLVPVLFKSYLSQQFSSLHEVLYAMRREHPADISTAAFGLAGPVSEGRGHLTNLGWDITADEIRDDLKVPAVGLLNDLEATAYGTLHLLESEKVVLQGGTPREHGAIVVIAAGTGLGEGLLVWNGKRYQTVPSEGGHADFAARNDLEMELLKFLLTRYEHVSWERILSGPGLYTLYEFLRARAGVPEPPWLKEQIGSGDPAAAVSRAGMERKDPVCSAVLDLFVSLYGAEAGNLALKFLGTGGVFVGGGIAPKILDRIQMGSFIASFNAKGRLSDLVRKIPVAVVTNDRIALTGAAHFAQLLRLE